MRDAKTIRDVETSYEPGRWPECRHLWSDAVVSDTLIVVRCVKCGAREETRSIQREERQSA